MIHFDVTILPVSLLLLHALAHLMEWVLNTLLVDFQLYLLAMLLSPNLKQNK